jgi:cell division protein FtsQ
MFLGYVYLSKSDYFTVNPDAILVKGLARLSKAEVLQAAGLDKPVNIITLDTAAALRSLKSLPWVDKAQLSRSIPDSVSLEIVEYRPIAVASLEHLYYINEEGRPFKKLDPGENPNLPIINGFSVDDLMHSGPLVKEGIAEVHRLMTALSKRTDEFNIDNISEFYYDPDRGLTIYTRSGALEVKVGFGSYTEKFARLGRVMTYMKVKELLEGLVYINLDCPPRVMVRYKPSFKPQLSQTSASMPQAIDGEASLDG